MANEFFNATGTPGQRSAGSSAAIRGVFTLVAQGFDKLPTMAGNGGKLWIVNDSGTAISLTSAVSTNTVNAIVKRDGNGDFSARYLTFGKIIGLSSQFIFETSGTFRGEINNSLWNLGTVAGVYPTLGITGRMSLHGASTASHDLLMTRFVADENAAALRLGKSRASSAAGFASILTNDRLGNVAFFGDDGAAFGQGASIFAEAAQNWGVSAHGTRLVLAATASNSTTQTRVLEIATSGATFTSNLTVPTLLATSLLVGGGDAITRMDQGSYTPSISPVANIDSYTAEIVRWIRIGEQVFYSGMVQIDPTSAGVSTVFQMSLPPNATSSMTSLTHASGCGALASTADAASVGVIANATADALEFYYIPPSAANRRISFSGSYRVL